MVRAQDRKQPILQPTGDQIVDDKLIAEFDFEHTRVVENRRRAKRWWKLLTAALLSCCLVWQGLKYYPKSYSSSLDLHFEEFDEFNDFMGPDDHPHDCTRIQSISEDTHLIYNISTTPEKIGVVSRGPIAGNVTFVVGGTKGDDVEVDIVFRKHHWHDHPDLELDDPHPHPPPPALAICQFVTEDGKVKGVGLFAHPPCNRPHGPPHGPPRRPPPHHSPPPPPPPPHLSDERDTSNGHPLRFTGSSFASDSHPRHHIDWEETEETVNYPHPHPPWRHRPYPPILADIVIRFPKKANINSFSSSLALFKAIIEDLESSVTFKEFRFLNVGHPVKIEGLAADSVKVVSSRGGIHAKVSARKLLEVVSVEKPIFLNATLISDPPEAGVVGARLSIVGAKALIHADVKLVTPSSKDLTYTPSYDVKIANHHASSFIRFLEQPLKSALSLRGDTTGGDLYADMAPEYEGSFELIGVGKDPVVNVKEDVEDPYGEGRKRSVEMKKGWWSLTGTVSWLKAEAAYTEFLGHVKLVGTWAPLTLAL